MVPHAANELQVSADMLMLGVIREESKKERSETETAPLESCELSVVV